MNNFVPDIRLEPSEEFYIEAGCGHEVYEGEELYEWAGGLTLCPDCMEEKFDELTLHEKAELLGCRHIVVEKEEGFDWVSSGSVTCIEGNTSTTSNDNGGKVMRRTRNIYLVLGAYRPDYEASAAPTPTTNNTGGTCSVTLNMISKGSKGQSVKALQILLIGNGYSCGSYGADGDFGSATDKAVRRFQSAKGIGVDGIVGTNTWTKLLK